MSLVYGMIERRALPSVRTTAAHQQFKRHGYDVHLVHAATPLPAIIAYEENMKLCPVHVELLELSSHSIDQHIEVTELTRAARKR